MKRVAKVRVGYPSPGTTARSSWREAIQETQFVDYDQTYGLTLAFFRSRIDESVERFDGQTVEREPAKAVGIEGDNGEDSRNGCRRQS